MTTSPATPLITVVTPAYNLGMYIGEAVDSVLRQTFRNFEYLVVDDGSTDETVAEVERRAAADPRLRLIRCDHGGAARARNVGIEEAQGHYIAFLDGDDRWSAHFLEKQLLLIRQTGDDVAAVFCRSRVMSESGRVYYAYWQPAGRYDFDDMLIQSCPPRVGSSLLIKKAAFDQAGLFDLEIESAQDLDMWLRIQRDSNMPHFWGGRDYLVDVRKRVGAISRDHDKRFLALDRLAAQYAPNMKHSPVGMAYVRAAVFAYRAGADDFADRWAGRARQAGIPRLARDSYGLRLLLWSTLRADQRTATRKANATLRAFLGRAIGAAGGIQR